MNKIIKNGNNYNILLCVGIIIVGGLKLIQA